MNDRIVQDLTQHVFLKHMQAIRQAVDLLDDPADQVQLYMSLIASHIASFGRGMPAFRKLSEEHQIAAAVAMIIRALDMTPPSSDDLQHIFDAVSNPLARPRKRRKSS